MSAREIIAREFEDEFCGTLDGAPFGEKCVAALTSAGYRILAPGELDGVSLEADRLGLNAEDEAALARTIIESLMGDNPRALIQGGWDEGERTLIDGMFNLRKVARAVLEALPDAIRALKASPTETDGDR